MDSFSSSGDGNIGAWEAAGNDVFSWFKFPLLVISDVSKLYRIREPLPCELHGERLYVRHVMILEMHPRPMGAEGEPENPVEEIDVVHASGLTFGSTSVLIAR